MNEVREFGRLVREFMIGLFGLDDSYSGPIPYPPRQPAEPEPEPAPEPVPEPGGDIPGEPPKPPPDSGEGTPDFYANSEKKANFSLVNPFTGEQLPLISKYGVAGKGCLQSMVAQKLPEETMKDWPRMTDDPRSAVEMISLREFGGTLKSENGSGPVSMRLNPTYHSVGREEKLVAGKEYPKFQEFRQYLLFTLDMETGKKNEPVRTITIGNKLDDPIWMRARLEKPFGEQLPLKYTFVKDKVALWLWDETELDFYKVSPFTGEAATPIAFVHGEGDETTVVRAWKKEMDGVSGKARFVKYGPPSND